MIEFKQHIKTLLSGIYSDEEIYVFTYAILEKITGLSKTQLLAGSEFNLTDNQKEEIEIMISRLRSYEPIQYIIGETEFYGLKFKVNPAVLIPRPETEELVQWILKNSEIKTPLSRRRGVGGEVGELLDIGTGSGCIAISLKKCLPNTNISAMDISDDALKVAKENAQINNVEISFIQSDILKIKELDKKYDVIVSNPPYVLEQDKKNMQPNVLDFEPHIALFVTDDDPLIFYRKIAELTKTSLNPNGKLYFEIHHLQGENIQKMLTSLGFSDIQIKKDISGNDRMIGCSCKT